MGLVIGELARAAGTAVETVRYYEEIGILPKPARTAGNYRSYGSGEVARLSFIRRARGLGFGLDQVRTLLSLADDHGRPCGEVDDLAQKHLSEVDRKIGDLVALRQELSSLISQCRQGTVAACRILEALGPLSECATIYPTR
ncbi:MAG: helix-turn-helix domain-containing protein [Pseudomonadota bacterium]